jgi:hypothetical protein
MLSLDDPRWASLTCALGCVCDRRDLIRALSGCEVPERTWDDAFNYVTYQGDIAEFSLAAAPYLLCCLERSTKVPWQPLSLLATIGLALRGRGGFADDLVAGFHETLSRIPGVLAGHVDRCWDADVTSCAVSCIALARGQAGLAEIYLESSIEELTEWFMHRDGAG